MMTTAAETLPLLRDTATRVRDDRAAPIRSQGEASSSGRGSKKPYRLLASIGAASLGLMLVAGTALGRGGLDGHLHLTSLGEAARGKARVSRHKGHGATVGAAHHASASMGTTSTTGSGSLGDITLEPRGIGQMPRADPIRPPQEQAADRQRERRETRRSARRAERESGAGARTRDGRAAADPTPDHAPTFTDGDPNAYERRKVLDPLQWKMNIEAEIADAAEKLEAAAATEDTEEASSRPLHGPDRFAWRPKLGVEFVDADELAERDALGANDRMQQRMAGTDMDVVDYARSHEAIVEFKEEQRERRRRDKMNYGDWLKSDDGKKAVTSLIPFPDFVAERADIPGLIEHVNVWANHHGQQLGFPDPEAKQKEAQGGFDEEEKMEFGLTNLLRRDDDTRIPIDDMDLRYVTYATHEYWPMVKTLIHSMERNAPRPLLFLTVMLTDEDDLAECEKLSKANRVAPFSCFLDFDALNILRREETESNQDRYNRDSDELLRGMYEQMAEGWGAAGSSSSSAGLGNMGGGDDDTGSDLATLGSDGRITRHAADMLRAMNRTQLVDAIVDLQHAHEARTSARHDGSAEVVEQPEEKPYVRDWVDDVTELGFIAIPAELADQFETRQKPVEPVEPVEVAQEVARIGLRKKSSKKSSKKHVVAEAPKKKVRVLSKKNTLGFVELPAPKHANPAPVPPLTPGVVKMSTATADVVTPLGFLKAPRANKRDARFETPDGEDTLVVDDPDAVTALGFIKRPGGDASADVGKGRKGPGVNLDKIASRKMNEKRQRALRVMSKWRKVHALYTLTKGGYGTVFIDAASVMIRDPTTLIKEEMKHNSLVTLSDFGGEKDQSLLNTGLLAAAPGKQTWDLLSDWIRTELYGEEDEQEHLVYDIAPHAKEQGKKVHGMPHQMFPSYLTFYKGRLTDIKTEHGEQAKYGDTAVVHAGYCGTVAGKKAFLDRVNKMDRLEMFSRHFGSNHGNWYNQHMRYKETKAERDGCDVHGRTQFRTCGKAPWDGACKDVWAEDADDLPELPVPPAAEAAISEASRDAITIEEAADIETTVMGISEIRKAAGTSAAQIA